MLRKISAGTERMLQKMGRKNGSETPDDYEKINEQFKQFCDHSEQVVKVVKQVHLASTDYAVIGNTWAGMMCDYGKDTKTELGVALIKFGNKFESIMELHGSIDRCVTDKLLKPLFRYIKEDIPAAQRAKTAYKHSKYEFDSINASLAKLKSKDKTDPAKIQLEERRTDDARLAMNTLLDDAVKSLTYAFEKGDYEYLKGMCALMRQYSIYFDEGVKLMEGLKPYVAQLEDAIGKAEKGEQTQMFRNSVNFGGQKPPFASQLPGDAAAPKTAQDTNATATTQPTTAPPAS
eukprot:ANDGO_00733.mRNA.1 hypothetical protein